MGKKVAFFLCGGGEGLEILFLKAGK